MVDKQLSFDKWKVNFSTPLKNCHPDRCIQGGLGAHCLGKSVGGQWSQKEPQLHINLLELKAVHLALLTFSKAQNLTSVHMDNMTALSYLVKMGALTAGS